VQRIYVDGGSSSEVIYEHFFKNLGPDMKAKLRESRVLLVGFLGEVNYLLGVIDLSVTIREQDRIRTVVIEFTVVKWHSLYNVILGRTGMRRLRVVASTIYSMIRFPDCQ
ncbi:reverse transcriptase domain-containing protein, partial [Tanacetum coccineum]